VSLDPYPDLPDPVAGSGDDQPAERPELSEADSLLLAALSQPEPPVVVAVEDQPRVVPAARDEGGRGGALAPVFREPAD
jgi:hypothetical protein